MSKCTASVKLIYVMLHVMDVHKQLKISMYIDKNSRNICNQVHLFQKAKEKKIKKEHSDCVLLMWSKKRQKLKTLFHVITCVRLLH